VEGEGGQTGEDEDATDPPGEAVPASSAAAAASSSSSPPPVQSDAETGKEIATGAGGGLAAFTGEVFGEVLGEYDAAAAAASRAAAGGSLSGVFCFLTSR
jgi:hypothetical protein